MLPVLAGILFGVAAGGAGVWYIMARAYRVQLATQLKKQSEFVSAVTQQLRVPLNHVLGMSQTLGLRADQLGSENKSLVETLNRSGGVLKGALLDVLDLLDLTSSQLRFDRSIEFLPETLKFLEKTHQVRASENSTNLTFNIKSSAEMWMAYDEGRIRQCVSAMLRQCIEQTPGGDVQLTAEVKSGRHGEQIVITVRDNCGGMDQKSAETYFSPTRYKNNRYMKDAESRVLALVLARMLARKMGGNLVVRSAYSNGVLFQLRVPASFASPPDEYEDENAATPLQMAQGALDGVTVLVAEDNAVNIQIMEVFLKKAKPRRILVAKDGRKALETMARESVGLVLMDIQMPVMDGITATKMIRSSKQEWADVPILAVTAGARAEERTACEEAGVSGFLAKPISAEEVYKKISRTMSKRPKRREL